MKRLNQKGMTGPVEIGLIAVFVIFVGIVAYRIGSARTDNTVANNAADSSEQEASEIAKNEAEEDKAKEIDLPKDEEKKEEVIKEDPATEPIKEDTDKPTDETDEEKKKDKVYISYLSSSMSQDATTVSVTAKLESRQTGTCYMKLYKDGQEKLIQEKRLEFQETCDAVFNKADIPVDGKWEFHTWFNGDDGKTEAYRSKDSLEITL